MRLRPAPLVRDNRALRRDPLAKVPLQSDLSAVRLEVRPDNPRRFMVLFDHLAPHGRGRFV